MSNQAPTMEVFLKSFSRYSAVPIDADKGLFAQDGLDSVRAVEWLYALEDEYDAELDAAAMAIIENGTLRDLYTHLFADSDAADS